MGGAANSFQSFLGINPGTPDAKNVGGQYLHLLDQYVRGLPRVENAEATYKPQFIDTTLAGVEQAQPDWLNLYGTATGTAGNIIGGANTATRWANVGDVASQGGAAADAVRGINPGASALTDELTQTASSQLAAGTQLAPADANRITQSVRSDWSNRGLGTSAPAQLDEAVQLAAGGQNVLVQRESAAAGAVSANDWITNPSLALTTGTSAAPVAGAALEGGASALATGAGPTLVSPAQNYDLLNTTYNATAASQLARANNTAGIEGGLMSY